MFCTEDRTLTFDFPFRNNCDMMFERKCVVYKNFQVLLAFCFGHFFKVYPGLVRACSRSLLSRCGRVLHRAANNLTGQTVSSGMSFMKIIKKGLTQIRPPMVSRSHRWPSLIWPHSQYVFAYVSRNDSMEKDQLQWRQMTAVCFHDAFTRHCTRLTNHEMHKRYN